ncbi:hypothetical protein EVAR_21591_1 [Eumeta japonica]|uniref:Uncharacterized protein n=1 Tax=Eumeta variegata TaxID=151549 RepID=A0A4C1UXC5_EUMVA|nr:hypothetical protein EVAR_21591_1 [Eumeta japonica]
MLTQRSPGTTCKFYYDRLLHRYPLRMHTSKIDNFRAPPPTAPRRKQISYSTEVGHTQLRYDVSTSDGIVSKHENSGQFKPHVPYLGGRVKTSVADDIIPSVTKVVNSPRPALDLDLK